MKKTKSDIAAEYCINFSTVPSRTLAQKIKDEHPEMGGLEDIRSCVRYVRGRHGAGKQRVKWTDIKFNYNSGGLTDFGIPISESYNTTPVKFTTGKWLILSDTQMPFHEAGAITRAKLAEEIWKYLNGRYESYEKETMHVAKMIRGIL